MINQKALFVGSTSEDHVRSCCKYFDKMLSETNTFPNQFIPFIEAILVDSVSVGLSRKVINHVILKLKKLDHHTCIVFCRQLQEALYVRIMSFEDQITDVLQHMANLLESDDNFCDAALYLSAIPLDNSQKNYSKTYITQMYLKIAHLYLQGRDPNNAELFINRASLSMTSSTESALQVMFTLFYFVFIVFH